MMSLRAIIVVVVMAMTGAGITDAANLNSISSADFQSDLDTAAVNGEADVITLDAGVFETDDNGSATFTYFSAESNDLTIQGQGMGTTLLDGNDARAVLAITQNGGAITVQDLTIRNGSNTADVDGVGDLQTGEICNETNGETGGCIGGGLSIEASPGASHSLTVDIDSVAFTDNTGSNGGGLHVRLGDGSITLTDSVFTDNTATDVTRENPTGFGFSGAALLDGDGGGAFLAIGNGFGSSASGTISVTGSTFNGNTATADPGDADDHNGGNGGALVAIADTVDIIDNQFISNTAASANSGSGVASGGNGGGLSARGDTLVTLDMNTFDQNSADGTGGGAALHGPSEVRENTFTDNTSGLGGIGGDGGALHIAHGDPVVADNQFDGNVATGGDGGAYKQTGGTLQLTSNQFNGNAAINDTDMHPGFDVSSVNDNFITSPGDGGGLHARTNTDVLIEDNSFQSNVADGGGGGAYLGNRGLSVLSNNTFFSNTARGLDQAVGGLDGESDGRGGGAHVAASPAGELRAENNTFQNNTAQNAGGGALSINAEWLSGTPPEGVVTTISGSTYSGNTASGSGNDVFMDDQDDPDNVDAVMDQGTAVTVFGAIGDFFSLCSSIQACVANLTFIGPPEAAEAIPALPLAGMTALVIAMLLLALYRRHVQS